MRPKQPWVQSNAGNPLGNEARILTSCHAAFSAATTCEQETIRLLVGDLQVIIDRLTGLFAQFKSDRSASLLLSYGCAVRRVSARSDITDLDRDDIATAKLTVDRQIEHCKVAGATVDLEFRPNRPDVPGPQRWLRSCQLTFIPGDS